MSATDERVERVADAMYTDDLFRFENRHGTHRRTVIGHSWATIATEYPVEAEEWRHRARAAIAALDAEPLSGYVTIMSSNGDPRYIVNGEEVGEEEYKDRRRAAIRAALDAEPSLEGVLPDDWNIDVRYEGDGSSTLIGGGVAKYRALIGRWDAHASGYFEGCGETRVAAIRAAIANAKGGEG